MLKFCTYLWFIPDFRERRAVRFVRAPHRPARDRRPADPGRRRADRHPDRRQLSRCRPLLLRDRSQFSFLLSPLFTLYQLDPVSASPCALYIRARLVSAASVQSS
ncbi:hypothetical protein ANCDUO_20573 [Ancylostoma duodenale]|uniref:Uncharacterized protein n=1 Tax=Ancylostoma duodenale TaxID=51022 RepID=A0A0C2CHV8_9BILA|nr:hypothetical protein ANCDUO_20573 [Ancylostoma duodenale]